MKFFIYFLVIILTILVNVNCTSPPNPPTPYFDVCDQPNNLEVVGRAIFTRYFYNKDAGECQSFIFGGGPQTENNFETKAACDARCPGESTIINGSPNILAQQHTFMLKPLVQSACDQYLITEVITPPNAVERFYFNNDVNECQSYMYGGGPKTENYFETKEACIAECESPVFNSTTELYPTALH